jgi:hypothetical protein
MPKEKVECDYDCLHCALSDCTRSSRDIAKLPKSRKKKRDKVARDTWAYAYLAEVPEPDYTTGLTTKKMDKTELEAMLVAQYGRKLEPVTGSRRRRAK